MVIINPGSLLNRLLKEKTENSWLEFKCNNSDVEVIGKWVSACSNAAILAEQPRAFLVFGIEDKTKELVGTTVRLSTLKKEAIILRIG